MHVLNNSNRDVNHSLAIRRRVLTDEAASQFTNQSAAFSQVFKVTMAGLLIHLILSCGSSAQTRVHTGSKLFTESVILGEIATQLLEEQGIQTEFYEQLGGTRILWNALLEGEIDVYPDYTGTITQEILGGSAVNSFEELNEKLAEFGVRATRPLGFNNTYAMGMLNARAEELGIESISDLKDYPDLRFGFSNEFLDRADGWPGLSEAYGLNPGSVTGLDHDLAYRGLEGGNIDLIDLYSTDAEIEYYNIRVLEDDLNFFPEYEAVFLWRTEVDSAVVSLIKSLEGTITENEMITMNAAVKLEGRSDEEVASEFLQQKFGVSGEVSTSGLWSRLWQHTLGHLYLVGIS